MPFKSPVYPVELYRAGAVDAERLQVIFTTRNGQTAQVSGGPEVWFTTGPRSCTCMDFSLEGQVCLHMRARDRAFRRFARDYRLPIPQAPRPLWAEDVGD